VGLAERSAVTSEFSPEFGQDEAERREGRASATKRTKATSEAGLRYGVGPPVAPSRPVFRNRPERKTAAPTAKNGSAN
jgi:hypothetical protein